MLLTSAYYWNIKVIHVWPVSVLCDWAAQADVSPKVICIPKSEENATRIKKKKMKKRGKKKRRSENGNKEIE